MKRLLFVLLALAMVLPVFAAAEKDQAAEGPITLRVLNYADATTPAYAVEKEIWDTFRAQNPDIVLEYEELFDEAFHTKTEAYAAAGRLPDVMFMWPSGRSSTLYNRNLVKDLTPLMAPVKNEFVPIATSPGQFGILGQIPQSTTNTHVLYANLGLLKKLGLSEPKTYADLVAMVPAARAAGVEVVLIPAKSDWVMQSCLFSMVLGRIAGDEFINDVLAGKANFTDKPFVDSLAFIKRLYDDGVISRTALQIDYGEGPALFASEKSLFYIDGAWRVGEFITSPDSGVALIPPAKQQSDFKLMNFPVIPGEKNANSSSVIAGTGFGMNANIEAGSAKEAAAWRLISYLNSAEVLKKRLETGAFSNVTRIGVTASKMEPLQVMNAQLAPAKATYVVDGILDASVYGPINIGLQEMALGTATPEQVAQTTQKAFEEWEISN
ncbi:MAG: extracellular solute-binding protein [Spirochaetes bacterium]|nr:extracellular solute-binding protein [Spirochaetota bacterium]MBU0956648.1 extracellular solute-binding protein [Spirochaetota bacterium]